MSLHSWQLLSRMLGSGRRDRLLGLADTVFPVDRDIQGKTGWNMRFLDQLFRRKRQTSRSGPVPPIPEVSQAPTCDRCGQAVRFERPDSGSVVVTFSTPPMTSTLCAACALNEEKERQWRETGIWIGDDLPPSLKSMREATPAELRKLLGEDD